MPSSNTYEIDISDNGPASFMLARIEAGLLREAVVVGPDASISAAYRRLRDRHADCLLVGTPGHYGIVTATDLLDRLILDATGVDSPIGPTASYDLITIPLGAYVFRALVLMVRHNIERLVVFDGDRLAGVLELTDVLSQLATQSHALGIRVERATSVEELAAVARSLDALTGTLVERGATVQFIMELLAALNGRTMARLFEMLVPADLHDRVCLVVMGSEARGEQILKTDQDNAVILADGFDWPDRQRVLDRFSATLSEFGYPPCPGFIMVSNPDWVMSLSGWQERLDGWIRVADGEAMLNLSVTSDMHAVAGNPALFDALNGWLLQRFTGGFGFFSSFVQAALQFAVPLNFFGNLKGDEIDIKKGGIFPIVHGVRALALARGIGDTNTYARLSALVDARVLDARQGRDLAEAFSVLNDVRLRQQLAATRDGGPGGNILRVSELDLLERDRLREALGAVRTFRHFLVRHFHVSR